MNLLLDALKKSGKTTSPLNIPAETGSVPDQRQYDSNQISAIRAGGANLFASKTTSDKKHKYLGIVPVVSITGLLMAAAGGYYIYMEVTRLNQRAASPLVRPVVTPAPLAALPAILALAPVRLDSESVISSPLAAVKQAVAMKRAVHSVKADNTNNGTLNIRHQQEAGSIDPILASAYESYRNGDYATAWQRYREALVLIPDNRDALLGLAVIAQQEGKNDVAVHYYRQVLMLDPRDPIAHAGLSALGGGDSANKESRLKQLISQQPDSAALYFALGHQYAEQLRWSDAQQAYFNALAMESDNALFAFNLAICLDHLGQYKIAAQYYRQALKLDTAGHSRFNFAHAQLRLNELVAQGN